MERAGVQKREQNRIENSEEDWRGVQEKEQEYGSENRSKKKRAEEGIGNQKKMNKKREQSRKGGSRVHDSDLMYCHT